MQIVPQQIEVTRYARCVEASRRVRWEIDRDVFRGRTLDPSRKFLPDGLSRVRELAFLHAAETRLLSRIQGRTYANIFGLVERYITAKVLDLSRSYCCGDQAALEALVRFTDEEIKHQELFRRLEEMAARGMPDGYSFLPRPNEVASAILSRSTWAVLALTCHIELFTQVHYRQSIESDAELCEVWKDVFRFHWKEESQHAILDELEWRRENERLDPAQVDQGVGDFIALVGAVDGILLAQAAADAAYFLRVCGRVFDKPEADRVGKTLLAAYRWQYILSGAQDERFLKILGDMVTADQMRRIGAALQGIAS
jgi:hypothetical protein